MQLINGSFNWQLATLFMFLLSVALYLLIRYLKRDKLNPELLNMFIFGVPAVVAISVVLLKGGFSTQHAIWQLAAIVLIALLGSFAGGFFSILGQNAAPNPGYSLVIQKGYGAATIFLAVPLFGAVLHWLDFVFALLTLGGVIILVVQPFSKLISADEFSNKAKAAGSSSKWLLYSFISFASFGGVTLGTRLMVDSGVVVDDFIAIVFSVATVAYVAKYLWTKYKLSNSVNKVGDSNVRGNILQNPRIIISLITIGLLSYGFNFFKAQATVMAPNPGVVDVVNASSIVAVTVGSAFIYNDELNWERLLGVLVAIGGLGGLFLG